MLGMHSWVQAAQAMGPMLAAMGTGAWYYDIEKEHTVWTEGMYRICGLEVGTALEQNTFFDLIDPEDRPIVAPIILDFVTKGGQFKIQFRLRLPNGQRRWVEDTGMVLAEANGRPTLIGGLFRDITEFQGPLEAALAEDQVALTVQDDQLRYVWMHNGLDRYQGLPSLGLTDEQAMPDKALAPQITALKKQVLADGKTVNFENWLDAADGQKAYIRATISAYTFPDGRRGVLVKSRDETEAQLAQERQAALQAKLEAKVQELAETQARLDAGMVGSPYTLFIQDDQLRYHWIYNIHPNWDAAEYLGKTDEESGLDAALLEQVLPAKRATLADGELRQLELWTKGMVDEPICLRFRIMPYTFSDGRRGIIVKGQDITEDRRAQQVAEHQAEQLILNVSELEEYKLRFDAALEGDLSLIYILDADLRFTWLHDLYADWGQPEMYIGLRHVETSIPEDVLAVIIPPHERVAAGGPPEQVSSWLPNPMGELKFFRWYINPYPFSDGTQGVIVKVTDLTQDRLREEQIQTQSDELAAKVYGQQQAEILLSTAMEDVPLSLWLQDENLVYVWERNAYPNVIDRPPVGLTDYDFGFPEEQIKQVVAMKRQVLDSGEPLNYEDWYTVAKGNQIFVRVTMRPYPMPSGATGLLCKIYDLTEDRLRQDQIQTQANELATKVDELEQADIRLGVALEDSSMGIWVQDEHQRFVWSRNFPKRLYAGDVAGITEQDFGFTDEQTQATIAAKQQVMDTGVPMNFAGWFDLPDGSRLYAQATFRPYEMPNGKIGMIGRFLDLTELREIQEKVETLNLQLEDRLAILTTQHEAKMRDLAEAREMQISLLPDAPPILAGLVIAAYMQTSDEVGGDYYDFLPVAESGQLIIAVGDATGHGLRAGTMVAMVKAYFQLLSGQMEPAALLHTISERLAQMRLKRMYMALTVLCYEPRTGSFSFAAAGMPPMRLYRAASGQIEEWGRPAMYLGTDLVFTLRQESFTVAPGDVLVILTDGLTEARAATGQMLPLAALDKTLALAAPAGPEAIIAAIRTLQTTWQGHNQPDDDTTLVVIAKS